MYSGRLENTMNTPGDELDHVDSPRKEIFPASDSPAASLEGPNPPAWMRNNVRVDRVTPPADPTQPGNGQTQGRSARRDPTHAKNAPHTGSAGGPVAETMDTNAKALRINLDPLHYGTFAEIGGGQEVSRWFFHVGGASGTVAKAISAYDMTVSDALYGHVGRYVCRERLVSMLDREYVRLLEPLSVGRRDRVAFFVFANTVATRSHDDSNECHGWIGIRFQLAPNTPPNDMVIHVNLRDPTAVRQQQTLGILGVNCIYAALYHRSRAIALASLMDGLSIDNVEVDVVECAGPAFSEFGDNCSLAIDLLRHELAHAIVFDEQGRMDQPSFVVHKRALLLHRCSITRDNPELDAMLDAGEAMLRSEFPGLPTAPLRMLEISLKNVRGEEQNDEAIASDRIASLLVPRHGLMVTRWAESYQLTDYLRRYSTEPIRFVVGLDIVVQMLRDHFYHRIDGGILEGLGRLLASNVRVYVFSMPLAVFRERLALYGTEKEFCRFPEKAELSLGDLRLAPPVGHLFEYLHETGWLVAATPQSQARAT
jgi:hypothetical protein